MIRRHCNLEGWHKITLHLTRGGLRILVALALAFVLVGANPSSSAQAAPASDMSITFFLAVIPSADYVCVNKSMTFRVKVWAVSDEPVIILPGEPGYDPEQEVFDITNVKVNGMALDMSIGVIEPDSLRIGSQSALTFSAQFTFTAFEKPGETRVFFDAVIPRDRAGGTPTRGEGQTIYIYNDNTQVEVRNCGYKLEGYPATYDGIRQTGGLSCDSPYGPWDFTMAYSAPGVRSSVREYIPWSEDGKATAMREEHSNNQNVTGADLFGIHDVTITPNSGGYQIYFPAPHMMGIWWWKNPDGVRPIEQTKGDWYMNIVPADPGQCP